MSRVSHKRPSEAYRQLVGLGEIDEDPAQLRVIERLDALCLALDTLPSRKSGLSWLFKRKITMPKGLYLWGSVGRGKTMLMDLVLDSAPLEKKARLHFQSFMADVHRRIHAFRLSVKRGEVQDTDPVPSVAAAIASELTLLCLDEFSVSDIADAMILARLFTALFDHGLVLVATSNVAPDRLYHEGLNRALFLPFIDVLKTATEIIELDAPVDYRLEKIHGGQTWFTPLTSKHNEALEDVFRSLSAGRIATPQTLTVLGHAVHIPRAYEKAAWFDYADLCQTALGANDFVMIAERFDTVFISNIPVIAADQRNEAKRFIALIDALYDRSVKLYASAADEPQNLYHADDGREAFEFDRTASRLIEMQSEPYRALPHGERLVGSH